MKNRPERTVMRYALRGEVDPSLSLRRRVSISSDQAAMTALAFRQARQCRSARYRNASALHSNIARESQRLVGWFLPPSVIHKGKARSKANGRARRH